MFFLFRLLPGVSIELLIVTDNFYRIPSICIFFFSNTAFSYLLIHINHIHKWKTYTIRNVFESLLWKKKKNYTMCDETTYQIRKHTKFFFQVLFLLSFFLWIKCMFVLIESTIWTNHVYMYVYIYKYHLFLLQQRRFDSLCGLVWLVQVIIVFWHYTWLVKLHLYDNDDVY